MSDNERRPTDDEIARVRRFECASNGHSWDILASVGDGPFAVVCGHCGEDSGLRRAETTP